MGSELSVGGVGSGPSVSQSQDFSSNGFGGQDGPGVMGSQGSGQGKEGMEKEGMEKLNQLKQDMQSLDPLKRGNAKQEFSKTAEEALSKFLEEFGGKRPGEQGAGTEGVPPAGSGTPPADGTEGGGSAPSIEEIIKMLAEKLGIPEDQAKQLLESLSADKGADAGQDSGMQAPSKADAMFA